MRPVFRMRQLTLFLSTFLLIYMIFFMHSYITFNISPDRCDIAEKENNTLKTDYSYQEQLCGPVFEAFEVYYEQRENLNPVIVSLVSALVVTSIFSYYKKLEFRYHELGI